MTTDQELIERIQAQDPQAFELLFERYAASIRTHLNRIVRSEPAAEDMLQETLCDGLAGFARQSITHI